MAMEENLDNPEVKQNKTGQNHRLGQGFGVQACGNHKKGGEVGPRKEKEGALKKSVQSLAIVE